MSFRLTSRDSPSSSGPLPPYYAHDDLALPHGFFTTAGGVSTGLYETLNCGFGSADDQTLVHTNRARAAASLGLDTSDLAAVYQVHGATTITVTSTTDNMSRDDMPRADGLVTATPGLGLSILTADCLPVLLADQKAGVIGACHAGWRGACGGITSSTIAAMRALGATNITALIGPTIQQHSYQVGAQMRDQVLSASQIEKQPAGTAIPPRAVIETCFIPDTSPTPDTHIASKTSPNDGKFLFDLPAYVAARLQADGITTIHDCAIDTYPRASDQTNAQTGDHSESPHLFSHRRATHAGEADSGRQISIITLPK